MKLAYFQGGSALAVAVALSFGGQAAAQATNAPAASAPHSIDELVVTAQKREQSLQDVPIVVTSVNAQQLQDAGVRDIKDLTVVTPGLTVTTTSSSAITTARIRGIGTVGDNVGLESSVGVVIDEVYRPRNGVAFSDLGELDRVEVLKGPQGTLFGKNTTAGVINVITKRPEFTFGANSEATFGNLNTFGFSTSVTGPLIEDKLAGRLFVAGRHRDGYYERVGRDTNDQNYYTGRGQLLWRPSADVDVNFAADYTKRHEACCGAVQLINGPTAPLVLALAPGGIANPPDIHNLRDYGNRNDVKDIEDKGAQAIVNWDTHALGNAKLTSVTAYRDWLQKGGGDVDWTGADILYSPKLGSGDVGFTEFKTFTQEFRLAGSTDKLNWLVGAFYSDEKLKLHVRTVTYGNQFESYLSGLLAAAGGLPTFEGHPNNGTAYAPGAGQNDTYDQHERGFALFTNENYKITDALELTVGLRYTWEKKDLATFWNNTDNAIGCATAIARFGAIGRTLGGAYPALCATSSNPLFGQIAHNNQHKKENELTGTAKLSYRFSPEVLAYASYAHGYKAGGFNLDRIAPGAQSVAGQAATPVLDTSFAQELVDSYEVGVKNTLLDRTLLLNATVFYQEYKDFQLNAFNGLVFTVASVPKVISKGVDADFLWFTPVEGLSLNGGATYAETYYPTSTPAVLGARLPGSRLSLAPLWSISGAGTYEHPIGENLVGRFALNAKYVSSYNTGSDLNPVKTQKGFTLVNARIGIGPQDKKWQAELWAQNLFDKRYKQVAFDSVFQTGSYDAFMGLPRTYGVTVRYTY
ncbi:TonB-dependent receptor [Phenylobacterium soli]|uniref:TonB-dependent receptor n=1 Tax=Phenylobacterium soli TaxID=2170551 RepID=A0A328AES2_9CAUL|nr:TonB-dependent receptor [Phenylobacterium soli]RAK53200.1 TonB-dependent receptor [Phenylobacterium soli]